MIREFQNQHQALIYGTSEFKESCVSFGANTIFQNIIDAICTTCQSSERHGQNKKIAMATLYNLYNLCFAPCQRCNFLQKENTLLLMTNIINKEALNTEHKSGMTCCARAGNCILEDAERKNADVVHRKCVRAY